MNLSAMSPDPGIIASCVVALLCLLHCAAGRKRQSSPPGMIHRNIAILPSTQQSHLG